MSKERRGSVTVIHVAEDTGKLLKQESYIQENALVGTPYKATKEDFSKEGYSFAHMGYTSAPEEGTVKEGRQTVIYYYHKIQIPQEKKGSVILKYVDQDGNEIGRKQVAKIDSQKVGTLYSIDRDNDEGHKELLASGWDFVRVEKASDPESGEVQEWTKQVVYVYKKTQGSVKVKYVDEAGIEIPGATTKVVKTGKDGEAYKIDTQDRGENKAISGYTFVRKEEASDPEEGVLLNKDDKVVVYVYKKDVAPILPKGSITYVYVDDTGKEITREENKEQNLEVNKEHAISTDETINKNQKEYTKVFAPEKVTVKEGENIVYVLYKEKQTPVAPQPKEVTIVYVDQDGNEIGNKKVTGNEGETVTINADEKVTSNDGTKSYEKVKNQEDKVVVTPGENKVVVVYKDVTPKTAVEKEVTIVYVDQDGNEIGNKKVTGNEGETVTINADEKVTSNDGTKSYEKVKNQEDKVVVTPGENKVVVVYKDVTPKRAVEKEVTIVYVDQDGNEIGNKKVTGNEGETVTIDADEKVTSNDGTKSYEKVKNQEDKVVVTPGENKVVVVYKDVTPKTAVEKEVTIVYVDQDGNEIGNKKVTGNEGETVTIDADEKVTSNDGTKSYEKVKNQEDKVVVTPGENKVVVVYKDVTPKTATTDSSSQTDSLPDPICPVPVKPDMTDNGTQTDPKEPGVDGGTQTDPKEPGVDGGTQTDPKEPGVDGGTQTDPKEPGVDGGTQTDPKEPGVDGGTQTDPKEPGVDGGTQTDPKEPGVDGGTQTDPKEPGVDGGTLVYKNNFKKIGDNIPQENSSLHQVSHKVAQNSEKRSDKIVSTEKEFPKTGEKQDNMLGLGLASITVAGLIALRMRKRRED
ncbi:MucBP domain-containing protein [Enterococcus faecalis]